MSQFLRPRIPGSTIYFEVALRDAGSDLLLREINLLRFAVGATLKDWPVQVIAWTVLPNKMLCMWKMPPQDADYSTRWRLIKSRFSRALPAGPRCKSAVQRSERAIWKRRFWEHHIRNQADYNMHLSRCYTAPADLGFVSDPALWRYSSFFKARQNVA